MTSGLLYGISFNPAIAREEWNEFIVRHSGSFLQSFEWSGFQEKAGNTVARIVIKKMAS